VSLLLSDQIWLWARNFQNGGPHLELLRRLAHWLMKEPELEEEALRASARGREITIERQSLKDEQREVIATAPSGARLPVALAPAAPGLTRASLKVEELGLYTISDGELTALVNVGVENPREVREVISTLDKLRPLAEATGGSVRRISAGGEEIALPRFAAAKSGHAVHAAPKPAPGWHARAGGRKGGRRRRQVDPLGPRFDIGACPATVVACPTPPIFSARPCMPGTLNSAAA
jgi:hypothetical protein